MKTLSLSLVFTVFIAAKAAEGNSSNLTNLFSSEAAVFAQDFRYAGADKQTGKPCGEFIITSYNCLLFKNFFSMWTGERAN